LERKTLDLSAKLGDFAIKRQATWGMSEEWLVEVSFDKMRLDQYWQINGFF
jgi:hypothetical protein